MWFYRDLMVLDRDLIWFIINDLIFIWIYGIRNQYHIINDMEILVQFLGGWSSLHNVWSWRPFFLANVYKWCSLLASIQCYILGETTVIRPTWSCFVRIIRICVGHKLIFLIRWLFTWTSSLHHIAPLRRSTTRRGSSPRPLRSPTSLQLFAGLGDKSGDHWNHIW